ncbi:hypothetical protein FHL15_006800 [Xylaria flabelliformis]|uniref:Uncharacterized protein n=1 Tax=Xylaria flabelliformis TaxID=2512241 RepID=A0A553HW61_9PEZI|nr:hypothetical protein FHL15_006800 [Xylaria flabelliformis]
MTPTAPPYHLASNTSEASLEAPTLPPYTEDANVSPRDEDIELASLSPSTSTSSHAASPPVATGPSPSSSFSSAFTPTKQLQIQTPGKNLISLPTPQRPDPIPIFTLNSQDHLERPLYLSVRPDARSGSCFLTHGDDESQTPLSATTYRFGPGRPPVIVLGDPATDPAMGKEGFEILDRNLFSRAVYFQVPGLGAFGWRYANSKERASAGADSLLVCEVYLPETTTTTTTSSSSSQQHHKTSVSARLGLKNDDGEGKKKKKKKKEGIPHRIAQLVRNEMYRTPGTTRSSAGNGGRLMLDLSVLGEKKRERVEWLVVTTAVTMLKREVDRRRAQQIAAIGAIAS